MGDELGDDVHTALIEKFKPLVRSRVDQYRMLHKMASQPADTADVANRSALKVILAAWLAAGTLDITAALVYYPLTSGVRRLTLLQGIASGALGARAFAGGLRTAVLGLAFHYFIALAWTLVFFVAAAKFKALVRHVFLSGMLYGLVVWAVMNLIVLPLSRVRHGPFHLAQAAVAAAILMVCVGLPIAAIVKGRSLE